jgi:hypothetical protein
MMILFVFFVYFRIYAYDYYLAQPLPLDEKLYRDGFKTHASCQTSGCLLHVVSISQKKGGGRERIMGHGGFHLFVLTFFHASRLRC